MFIAYTYLAIEATETAVGDRPPRSKRRKKEEAPRASQVRVTDERLDEMSKALARRLNQLVDRLPNGD